MSDVALFRVKQVLAEIKKRPRFWNQGNPRSCFAAYAYRLSTGHDIPQRGKDFAMMENQWKHVVSVASEWMGISGTYRHGGIALWLFHSSRTFKQYEMFVANGGKLP